MWSQLFATLFLKEVFTWPDAAATVLIAAGATTAAVFGAAGNVAATGDERFSDDIARFHGPLELAGLSADLALISSGILFLVYRWSKGLGSVRSYSECLGFSCVGGLFGCWSATTAKLVVAAVSNSFKGTEVVVTNYAFWLCLLGLAAALTCQIGFLNGSLKRYEALTAVPPYECAITLGGVASGWIFLGEADNVDRTALTAFFFGCAACCVGIIALSAKNSLLRRWPTWASVMSGAPPALQLDADDDDIGGSPDEDDVAPPRRNASVKKISLAGDSVSIGVGAAIDSHVSNKSLLTDVYGRRRSSEPSGVDAALTIGVGQPPTSPAAAGAPAARTPRARSGVGASPAVKPPLARASSVPAR